MASNLNITMKHYNGTDYDTMFPKTNDNQVLLTDSSKELLGITKENASVSDALSDMKQYGAGYAVGDTLTTARTNLGTNWLLCNGASINSENYPELTAILPPSSLLEANSWKRTDLGISTTIQQYGMTITKANEYYIIRFESAMTGDKTTYYTSDLLDPSSWKLTKTIYNNINFQGICYFQGKYCAVASDDFYYADSLDGPWETFRLGDEAIAHYTHLCTDGNRIFASCDWTVNNSPNTIWSTTIEGLKTGKSERYSKCTCVGGKVYVKTDGNYSSWRYCVYNESYDGFTSIPILTDTSSAYSPIRIVYTNGLYVITTPGDGLCVSSDGVNFTVVNSSTKAYYAINAIDDNVLLYKNLYSVTSTSATKIGTVAVPLSSVTSSYNGTWTHNDVKIVGSTTGSSSSHIAVASATGLWALPTVSNDKLYTYIKAK